MSVRWPKYGGDYPLDEEISPRTIAEGLYDIPMHPESKLGLPCSYFNLRAVCTEDGMPIEKNPDWFTAQTLNTIADNPRLRQQAQSAQPYYNTFFNPRNEGNGAVFSSTLNNGLSTN
jgi:hypothetical protein